MSTTEAWRRRHYDGHDQDCPRFPLLLPAKPLAEKLQQFARDHDVGIYMGHHKTGLRAEQFYAGYGVSSKTVCDWKAGRRDGVEFETAERVLMATGWDWADVWSREECPELFVALERTAVPLVADEHGVRAVVEADGWCECCGEMVTPLRGLCPWHPTVRVEERAA